MTVPLPHGGKGLKLRPDAGLTAILDALALDSLDTFWRLEWINAVWWKGNESPWESSWDAPLEVSSSLLREQAADGRQIINGRLTAIVSEAPVATVEAVDSTFWLIWSDDDEILDRVRGRFAAEPVAPPSEFSPHG